MPMNAVVSLRSEVGPYTRQVAEYELPPQPDEVRIVLRKHVSTSLSFPQSGGYRTFFSVKKETATSLSANERASLCERKERLRKCLSPAERGALLARVLSLLSHYRGEVHSQQVETVIANDWAEDLGEYPMWAINEAARKWRRQQKFKPQISEIIELCENSVESIREELKMIEGILAAAERSGAPLSWGPKR